MDIKKRQGALTSLTHLSVNSLTSVIESAVPLEGAGAEAGRWIREDVSDEDRFTRAAIFHHHIHEDGLLHLCRYVDDTPRGPCSSRHMAPRFLGFCLVLSSASFASGPEQKLQFDSKRFVVTYRSCGCADLCWTAFVAEKKAPKKPVFKLRCDCEQLFFEDTKAGTSVKQPETCELAQDTKFELITERLKTLLPK